MQTFIEQQTDCQQNCTEPTVSKIFFNCTVWQSTKGHLLHLIWINAKQKTKSPKNMGNPCFHSRIVLLETLNIQQAHNGEIKQVTECRKDELHSFSTHATLGINATLTDALPANNTATIQTLLIVHPS